MRRAMRRRGKRAKVSTVGCANAELANPGPPSEFTILSRKMTAPIVGIPEGQVGRRHRIQSCRFDASSVSQKAVSAAIGLDSGERTQ